MWRAVGLRILIEGEREEDGMMVGGRNWWEYFTANRIKGGGCEHKVYGRRYTIVGVVGRVADHLLERKYVRYKMNFVKERGGFSIVNIEITKKHKILCGKVGKRWK